MSDFRFAVMGAGRIARKFCDAVALADGAKVCAAASKSISRAEALSDEKGIPAAYDDYERMLEAEKPDCAYISTTCDAHYALSMLCARHGVPVLCEKAMFTCLKEAEGFARFAGEKGVFWMEALWSRFLPAIMTAREWVKNGEIGEVAAAEMGVGFRADRDWDNRFFSPALGGGAANDLTVYGLHLLPWVLDRPITRAVAEAVAAPTGVDGSSIVLLRLGKDVPAAVRSSLIARVDEQMVIYGSKGKILVPRAHMAREALLLTPEGEVVRRFTDETPPNGFVHEVRETVRCVRMGLKESPTVPHASTIACARIFDMIRESME